MKKLLSCLFCTVVMAATAHSQQSPIHVKYFVKENAVLLRWVPDNRTLFDQAVKNGYKIVRSKIENGTETETKILSDRTIPVPASDTVKWRSLFKKNPNVGMAYKVMYEKNIPASIPQKEKEDMQSTIYSLLLISCDLYKDIAYACGMFYNDSTIAKGNTYSYKIQLNDLSGKNKVVSDAIMVNTSILSVNPEIKNLTHSSKNKTIQLNWNAAIFSSNYSAYHVERSEDNVNYSRISKAPVLLISSQYEKNKEEITFKDTVPKQKIIYHYRIRGINFFGEESAPSNTVTFTGYEPLHSNPLIDTIKVIKNSRVRIHWQMSDKSENPLPKEYILFRSEKDDGPYNALYKGTGNFGHTDEQPLASNYYKIAAISHGNDTLWSFSALALILDTIPPAIPSGLKARSDSKGNVEITWDRNTEKDLQGYKLYRCNALHEEFTQINDTFARSNSYKDKLSLNNLSKKIYYAIAATDNNYNSSLLSAPIEVKKPDTIPPAASVIKTLTISQKGIRADWINSHSEDAVRFVLYRQTEANKSEIKITEWKKSDSASFHLDTLTEPGEGYRYKIITFDEDDNLSVSNNPYMLFETGFRKRITDVSASVDRLNKNITLRWNYKAEGVEKFILYRASGKIPLTIIKTLPSSFATFTDPDLYMGNIYEYRLKAVYKNGAESIISDAVIVDY